MKSARASSRSSRPEWTSLSIAVALAFAGCDVPPDGAATTEAAAAPGAMTREVSPGTEAVSSALINGAPDLWIQDVQVIAGSSSTIQCPSGFTKILQDLNQGAGGKYIYLCYTKDPAKAAHPGKVIHNFGYLSTTFKNTDGQIGSSNGLNSYEWFFTPVSPATGDLNAGTPIHDQYVYLSKILANEPCPAGATSCQFQNGYGGYRVSAITVVAGSSSSVACPSGYDKVPMDLNDGARGAYIYLCQKRVVYGWNPDAYYCDGSSHEWNGCRGNGCSVCTEYTRDYTRYFQHHPSCSPNTTCAGSYYACSDFCPPPTELDR
jgi:hypothetical protein